MAFKKGLYITEFAARGGAHYNYLGSTASQELLYNEDNRIPISPIRLTGGSVNRVTLVYPGPDSSPPCSVLRETTACIGMDEDGLDHDQIVGRITVSSSRRETPARNGIGLYARCFSRLSPAAREEMNRPEGKTHFDKE